MGKHRRLPPSFNNLEKTSVARKPMKWCVKPRRSFASKEASLALGVGKPRPAGYQLMLTDPASLLALRLRQGTLRGYVMLACRVLVVEEKLLRMAQEEVASASILLAGTRLSFI